MVDESKPNYSSIGFIFVGTSPGREKEVYEALKKFQYENTQINNINPVFGDVDLVVEISAKNYQVLGQCVSQGIRNIPGVANTKTLCGVCLDKTEAKAMQ